VTVPWEDLSVGDGVLLRFESYFNRDATLTAVGTVADHPDTRNAFSELVVDSGEDLFLVTWDGGVERGATEDGRSVWKSYGTGGRLWALDPVDALSELPDEDELHANDFRADDPVLPSPGVKTRSEAEAEREGDGDN
jgi:hypothetical protein